MITGALIGTIQDALNHHAICLFGIAKTVTGYFASSIGIRLNVDRAMFRFLMTFGFYLVHRTVYMVIDRGLVGVVDPWAWGHTLLAAVCNGILAVALFAGLDWFKGRR